MNLSGLLGTSLRILGRGSLYAQKYSPEILTVLGALGVVGTTVLAARATLKLEETVEDAQERIFDVQFKQSLTDPDGELIHSNHEIRTELTRVYIRNGMAFVRLYGPTVTLGVLSLTCLIGANGILRRRNMAMVAAYKTLESAYSSYRERVIEEYGAEKDQEFRYDIRKKEIEDPVTGKTKKVTGPLDPSKYSIYSRVFDRNNHNWTPNRENNLSFLTLQQNYANHVLQARGHVFLNDVYDSLGMERSSEAAIIGWVANGDGDNYIDFGIYTPANEELLQSHDREVLLDFNVDGIIWDKI